MTEQQSYQRWLRLFANDPELGQELAAIGGDPAEIADRFYRELSFGTAGMRGVLGAGTNRMNRATVRRATQGLADYITRSGTPGGVAIGYDSRRMSPEFALDAALTLGKNGVKAYLFDALRPVALLSFAVRHLKCAAGIVVTASHNPKQYNGYKVYWSDGGQLPPERAEAVQVCINDVDYASLTVPSEAAMRASGLLETIGEAIDKAYYARVLGLSIQPELCRAQGAGLSIVYTPLNGSGNVPVREVLTRAGFTNLSIVPQQERPDPDFTTVGVPNPENRGAFTLALSLADEKHADLVFATDPDCDRVGVAARKPDGGYALLSGNQIGCLLEYYILEGLREQDRLPKNGAVVKSIVTTQLANVIAARYGASAFDVLTGFKFIAEKIAQFEQTGSHVFLFGFEESYGFLSGSFVRDKDGVNAALLLAEAALWYKRRGMTLYEGLEALYDRFGWCLEDVRSYELDGMDGAARMKSAMERLRANPPASLGGVAVDEAVDYLPGLPGFPPSNVLFYRLAGGSWVCVRPSGTEPKIKLYACVLAPTRDAACVTLSRVCADADAMMRRLIG